MKKILEYLLIPYFLADELVSKIRKNKARFWIFVVLFLNIFGGVFLYQRFAERAPLYDPIDIGAAALDVTLAHTIVTVVICMLAFELTRVLQALFNRMFTILVTIIMDGRDWSDARYNAIRLADFSLRTAAFIFILYASLGSLIFKPGLQTFLFGGFDPSLGLNYPTAFRLTSLIGNFEILSQNLGNNTTLSKIFGFVGVISTAVVGVAGVMKALEFLFGKSKE